LYKTKFHTFAKTSYLLQTYTNNDAEYSNAEYSVLPYGNSTLAH